MSDPILIPTNRKKNRDCENNSGERYDPFRGRWRCSFSSYLLLDPQGDVYEEYGDYGTPPSEEYDKPVSLEVGVGMAVVAAGLFTIGY